MDREAIQRRVFDLFGEMLEYPGPGLASAVRECQELVTPFSPEAGALLGDFRDFVESTPAVRIEEVFSGAFDLDAACYPYVGYHLFGESYKRSVLMLGLKERYRAFSFEIPGNELPDHLAVILRFLAVCRDDTESQEIMVEALVPTLGKMVGGEDEPSKPEDGPSLKAAGRRIIYHKVIQALHQVLLSPAVYGWLVTEQVEIAAG